MTSSDGPTRFPLELEREIFETTARLRRAIIPTLLVVAHRVFVWIEPFLYRTLVLQLSSPRFLELKLALQSKRAAKPTFLRDSVRNLLYRIPNDSTTLHDILVLCTGIQTLALYSYPDLPTLIVDLSGVSDLRRLSAMLGDMGRFGHVETMNLGHPMLSNITHLELYDDIPTSDLVHWTNLALLPALTHLCIDAYVHRTVVVDFLQGCKQLEVLIKLFRWSVSVEVMREAAYDPHIEDPRLT
ncbi:hypothetical protein C8R43DRAFT_967028 [Mycena crocata]|nr:hypothetical protein C8R43DRAFT_967028 [Mycena crocata]